MTKHYLLNLWRWKCGLSEIDKQQTTDINSLYISEWNKEFEQLMRNRLVMGALRYGKIYQQNKPKYNRTDSMVSRINKYVESGNKEYLVDVANLCLLEFTECYHPKAHFNSIDDGEHVKQK